MLQVSFTVRYRATSIRASVRAADLRRAESLVKSRHPSSEVKMVFPIEPEAFFVKESSSPELVVPELPESSAA